MPNANKEESETMHQAHFQQMGHKGSWTIYGSFDPSNPTTLVTLN